MNDPAMLRSLPLYFATFALSIPVVAAVSSEDAEFFEKKIQPILSEQCFKCHSHSADKIKGGLVLDIAEGALTGGDTGPAIVPGDLSKSLLITAITYADQDLQMPPKGKRLSEEQVALLKDWVQRGAPWPKAAGGEKMTVRPRGNITDEDRKWWAFQPVSNPQPPAIADDPRRTNEIDQFVFKKLADHGLKPAQPAEPQQLVRRIYFDLIGLPPTPEESAAFVAAAKKDFAAAVESLVERLLGSQRYGERWARHWLDLVRYAESDGFKSDDYRPNAWRYREYVIDAFNRDKPYDRFVQEQLAGDELFPGDPEARTGTAFLRHWIYEYNNRDVSAQWSNILNEVTDVSADVFLGLGMQCARCHDHKFDPILQKDYYRLQAFFAPMQLRDDLMLATPEEEATYRERLRIWEEKTAAVREEIAVLEKPYREKAAEEAIGRFPPETSAIIRKSEANRTPLEEQLAQLAYRQVTYEFDRLLNRMNAADKDRAVALSKQLAAYDGDKLVAPPAALAVSDLGPVAPATFIPKKDSLGEIAPGFLTLLNEAPASVTPRPGSTGRRAALAEWLTQPENPLAARVIVNRVWQYHFGRGLVATASDFGKLGEPPSHPELLDWLARRFVEDGWSFKKLHRRILSSATWQQSALHRDPVAMVRDPENRLLWRANSRRLEAEQIRDSILTVTGELDLTAGGPSSDPGKPRRSIYTKVLRNTQDPLLAVFDAPDAFASTAQRNVTTTPTQSLLLINSPWMLARAQRFAERVQRDNSSDLREQLSDAMHLTLGRVPSDEELAKVEQFLAAQAERVTVPAAPVSESPFLSDKFRFRDGRAAVLAPGSPQEILRAKSSDQLPERDFTIEAFVHLRSTYEDAKVRTIVSHGEGGKGQSGWSLGVTGKKSRYKPGTLVLLLNGEGTPAMEAFEPIFSGVSIEPGRPYFVAVTVNLADQSESGITFYVRDMTNDDEPMVVANAPHQTVAGVRGSGPLTIGGRFGNGKPQHLWDGLIDDVRLSAGVLGKDEFLYVREGVTPGTRGYWRFEPTPGLLKDSSGLAHDIQPRVVPQATVDPKQTALVDFCHVLLNANEFLYVD